MRYMYMYYFIPTVFITLILKQCHILVYVNLKGTVNNLRTYVTGWCILQHVTVTRD